MHFGHESRAITMLFLNEIIPLAIPYNSSPTPMSMQCICKILLKFVYSFFWPKMHFGHKSRTITLLFLNEITPLTIPYHSSPIPMSMQNLEKIGKKVLKLEHGNEVQSIFHTSRAITLLLQNEISPLAVPYHSSLIPMSMQSLKKIGQKVLKLEHGNEMLMDRQTDGWQTDGRMDTPSSDSITWSYIYIYQCICKILLKFVYSFFRYWAKMHFGHESRAITMLFLNEIILLAIPYHSSPIPMSMQCICKTLLKFLYSFLRYWPKMHFGHKSRAITIVSEWNYPTCNPIPLLSDNNVYVKFEENR